MYSIPIREIKKQILTSKSFLIMRICLFLLICSMLQSFASEIHSQVSALSLKMKNASIEDVLNEIEEQTEYRFLYNKRMVDVTKPVNIEVNKESLSNVLHALFRGTDVVYTVSDRQIVLGRSKTVEQQRKRITGKVSDNSGIPVIGANVVEKGTTNGTITDVNGNFSLDVNNEAVLLISYIGYNTQEISVVGKSTLNLTLTEDSQSLEEVVVMGYGVQKKKLVTGSTVQVKGDDIQKLSTISPLTAMQSQTPGVFITSTSGEPDGGYKVNIRGLGTIGDASPLYIINGIVGGDLNSISASDIESIDVLKDAASAAIYGSRAANGVVLITTKRGKVGKPTVTYDGYVGIQNVAKYMDVLDAQQYMEIQNESLTNVGIAPNDYSTLVPDYVWKDLQNGWKGTNWLKEFTNKNAPVHNHALNISGGTEQSIYSTGVSYSSQEGIYGEPETSKYNRISFRANTEYILAKNNDFDIVKVGENILYTYKKKNGGVGNVRNMLTGNPLMPVYDPDGNYHKTMVLDADRANPIGQYYYNNSLTANTSHDLKINAFVEIQPIKNLIIKSNAGYSLWAYSNRYYGPAYNLGDRYFRTEDVVKQDQTISRSFQWENTISYDFTIKEHNFSALLGQSIEKHGLGENISGQNMGSLFDSFDYAYLNNVKTIVPGKTLVGGSPTGESAISSFFGRVNYNFKETYLASVILRTDGSSNFARGNRWGYFPSVSLGWVISNEAFMDNTKMWMDFLKIRASWGQNGNQAVSPFQYLATYSFDASDYFFGTDKNAWSTGAYPSILPNKDITWERSEQLDLGLDARFLSSRLGVTFDWYKKTTKDWLVQAPILGSQGAAAPYINGGDVTNKGVELSLTWNDMVGDFSYGVNANLAVNKNKITRIANSEGVIEGTNPGFGDGQPPIYRAQVGYPIGYFYGLKTAGVFQNQEQIDNYEGAMLSGTAPGDLIFVDMNKDGVIDMADRTMIGDPNPNMNLGLTVNLGYKGFDFSVTANGVFGNQIASSFHKVNHYKENYPSVLLGRWHGEGTSNRYPRLTADSSPNFMQFNDIYIDNGDFLRIQNVTLGYDFKKLFPKMILQQARLYVTVQNLYTFTGYYGSDPEIGTAPEGWSKGVDSGFYPIPRTVLVGANIKF